MSLAVSLDATCVLVKLSRFIAFLPRDLQGSRMHPQRECTVAQTGNLRSINSRSELYTFEQLCQVLSSRSIKPNPVALNLLISVETNAIYNRVFRAVRIQFQHLPLPIFVSVQPALLHPLAIDQHFFVDADKAHGRRRNFSLIE